MHVLPHRTPPHSWHSRGVARIVVDESRWPLVQIHWPDGEVTDEDVEAFLALGVEHLARRTPFISMHHGMRATTINAKQRRRFGDHVRAHEKELAVYMTAAAIVSPSAVIRAVVTAINWIAPPPYPQGTFATASEAEAWLMRVYESRKAS